MGANIYDQRERVTITTENSETPFSGMTLYIGSLQLRGGKAPAPGGTAGAQRQPAV